MVAHRRKNLHGNLSFFFASLLGHSLGAEIARLRLAKTKLLLRNSRRTIAAIAALTGFCTPSHLSNTFKAATGLSPRVWRATNQLPI